MSMVWLILGGPRAGAVGPKWSIVEFDMRRWRLIGAAGREHSGQKRRVGLVAVKGKSSGLAVCEVGHRACLVSHGRASSTLHGKLLLFLGVVCFSLCGTIWNKPRRRHRFSKNVVVTRRFQIGGSR